ncbi:MAG TPA: type IV secretion protein Rhs, partial [Xanthomonadales bacterium]|nr:type IV secretion protein Rhs [Xanthomonadales bacterium]
MPLFLNRTYNHYWPHFGLFGKHWLSNFDYSLAAATVDGVSLFWAQRPDGRRVKFVAAGTDVWTEDKPTPIARIVRNPDGSYTLTSEENTTEVYKPSGHILSIKNQAGIGWTFAYNTSNFLQSVTHTSGRTVTFTWSGTQLVSVTDPAGKTHTYTYLANRFGIGMHLLETAKPPGLPATTVKYHYENPTWTGALTGKSYNGGRFSTFAYDSTGRAISSEHAGGVERWTFSYALSGSTSGSLP